MKFISTRGQSEALTFSEAVAKGLAPDGGLYLPESLPSIADKLDEWKDLDYPSLCFEFMQLFATDIPAPVLQKSVDNAYATFTDETIAPVVKLDETTFVCELFHGPTLAFKDFALQLLGQLYAYQIEKTGQSINILGATSGDTGSAAIHGLMDLPGIKLFILYPQNGVAPLQERQMACTGSPSVFPIAIDGSFDDAQKWVKALFGDQEFKAEHHLSAINSINLARVLAQCVYYLFAWFRIPESQRADLEVIVPTGNFGNILAGWMLSKMGVEIPHFRIATNQNDILHRLFETGTYEIGNVEPSLAPSMDIQVASNFERFIYYLVDGNTEKVRDIMSEFLSTGKFVFENFDIQTFTSSRSTDSSIITNTKRVYDAYQYVVDPHTACAFEDLKAEKTQLIMSTAHPAKFPDAIDKAIDCAVTHPTLDALKEKPVVRYELASDPQAVRAFIEAHTSS